MYHMSIVFEKSLARNICTTPTQVKSVKILLNSGLNVNLLKKIWPKNMFYNCYVSWIEFQRDFPSKETYENH